MIDVLESKIPSLPSGTHLKAFKELLTEPNSPSLGGKGVDYAFSHLTLHHIVSTPRYADRPLLSEIHPAF